MHPYSKIWILTQAFNSAQVNYDIENYELTSDNITIALPLIWADFFLV